MEPHQLPWSPLDPAALPHLLGAVGAPWWLAGGWAIDAFVGQVTRVHEDTDVLVLRRDQAVFRSALASWDVHAADPPGTLRPWPVGETLPPEVQLLQKSKGRRPKDEADLAVASPLLSAAATSWLRDALDLVSPGHPWSSLL